MIVDLKTYPNSGARFCAVRAKVVELVEYMTAAGKKPQTIQLFPGDYQAAHGAVTRKLRKIAKEAAKAEEAQRRAKGIKGDAAKVKPTPEVVEAVVYDGIPVVAGLHYSKPRKVEA